MQHVLHVCEKPQRNSFRAVLATDDRIHVFHGQPLKNRRLRSTVALQRGRHGIQIMSCLQLLCCEILPQNPAEQPLPVDVAKECKFLYVVERNC
jgi:hypothetical protein